MQVGSESRATMGVSAVRLDASFMTLHTLQTWKTSVTHPRTRGCLMCLLWHRRYLMYAHHADLKNPKRTPGLDGGDGVGRENSLQTYLP